MRAFPRWRPVTTSSATESSFHGVDLRAAIAAAPTADAVREHAVDSALRRVTPALLAEDLDQFAAGGITVHDATKLVLWPVRLQHVCDTGQATGNADAVDYYLQLPDARHQSLAQDALGWRDLTALPDPRDALERITDEIQDLHAEVFQRLGDQAMTPSHDTASSLSGAASSAPSPSSSAPHGEPGTGSRSVHASSRSRSRTRDAGGVKTAERS